ncbi:methyltransferase-like protein 27 [Heptranchias perlo]|uniref:methyltransferase-like protein 27 n=1 Tax=Heptranchias perlo TaxID=212740 RepID=UPI00355A164D
MYDILEKLVSLINKSLSAVPVGRKLTEWFISIVEMRQGCTQLPDVFNLVLETAMNLALRDDIGGVSLCCKINRTFQYKTKHSISSLYKTLVGPHLEYYVQFWSAHMDVALINYRAPIFAAETLDPVFPKERDSALVLDVACGTGMVAEQLQNVGFKNFHGIDGSEAMLKVADSKNLYQSLKKCLIVPDKPLPVSSDTYDLVIVVGALSSGHVSPDVLPELLRVTKPGAYLCLTAIENKGSNYMQQLLATMEELENKGLWTKVVEQQIDHWQKAVLETKLGSE